MTSRRVVPDIAPRELTMATQVMNHVRDRIHSGDMRPDTWYSVYQLSEELGISRSPVRDGLLRLEEAGIIEFVRNRGFRVVEPNPSDVADIFSIRLSLEPAAAARAATHAGPGDIGKLRELLAHMAAAIERQDEATFFDWDQQLHDALASLGHSHRSRAILATLRTHTRLLTDSTVRKYRSLEQVYSEHLPIVDAIATHDAPAAAAAMRAHVSATGRLLLAQNLRKAHPEWDAPELDRRVDEIWERHTAHL
ncbi:GntR family transcriptional regulator [Corynebacterium lizhenjunii]|uniref:GntR family transcriptional regulator n=1 Tax=Corynebacterium lizhenjunii TaxID=2709394 RepID=A0A7T0KGE6_9CORY|nr:GntR family transcriptional regulator [Corynebacterium lizhenjunii]QPK79659.1 GntR family transcriptional regulator [Corynebacterium lizhenjunii]